MAFLTDIEQLRKVTWGTKYLWDVWFEGAPAPFDVWFPAVDVEEEVAHLTTYSFDTHQDDFKVPMSSTSLSLRITFHDSEDHALLKWLRDWINKEILHSGEYISTVESSIKLLKLLKLDHKREIKEESNYYVYPEGVLTFSGDSSSDPTIYTVNFIIVSSSIST